MWKYILSFVFIIIAAGSLAQTGIIKGRVSTHDGKPVPNANISLKGFLKGSSSDADGRFEIKKLNDGDYELVVSFVGLKKEERKLTVRQSDTVKIDIVLGENAHELNEVIVANKKSLNSKTIDIGRAGILPMDLPQGMAVIGQSLIKDQQVQRLSDVIKNINGVYLADTRGSTQEDFAARGYSISSNNLFKDGVRINAGAMPEITALERVEVLKGSAAILYGNVTPGGIINLVTAKPKFENGGSISFRAGSYDLYKPAFDVYGPFSNKLAYRINGTYESARSFRDVLRSKRYYINPSLLFCPNNKLEVLVQTDFLHHEFTPDFGIGTYDNTKIPQVPIQTFYGTPWQYAKIMQGSATAIAKYQINEKWQLKSSVSYQAYGKDYYSTERIQAAANGDWARPLNRLKTQEQYMIGQVSLNGKFKTGKIGHQVLVGMDAEKYLTKNYSYDQPKIYDTINIFDANKFVKRTDMPIANQIFLANNITNRMGAYVQDLISLSKKIKFLAGIRWSYQDASPTDTLFFASNIHSSGAAHKTDKAFSPRLGVVYRPTSQTSLFASYSNSFLVNTGTDVYGNPLSPSIVDQYEIGVKNELIKNMLSANLTVYRILNNNLTQMVPFLADGVTPNSNSSIKEFAGQTTSDGVELDATLFLLKGLDMIAGYSYNYIRYTKTSGKNGSYILGERLTNNPASTGNISVFYSFQNNKLKGFKLGSSLFYTGTRYAGFNNVVGQSQAYKRNFEVKGFATVDINASYSYKNLTLDAKISNLSNTMNYYVHDNYSINPIPPRQFMATLRYGF